jgi:hypothetical protein
MVRKLYLIFLMVALSAFSSMALGDNVSNLLEEGIYAEDTKGDLDEAISIYKKIIDENEGNRINIAKAYYRLGICYLKTGDEARAIEIFKRLINLFPEQAEIVNNTKIKLSDLGALEDEVKPLEIGPAPWEAGETCWYGITSPPTMSHVRMIMSVKSLVINGNDLWRFENYIVIPTENQSQLKRVEVLKKDFRPFSGLVKGAWGNIKVTYGKDHIQMDIESPSTKDKKEIPNSQIVYDNEQVSYLLRRLPIEKKYSTTISILNPQTGSVMNVKIRTTGLETVEVPAGKYECYGVELDLGPAMKQKWWFSTAPKKYLVKMDAGAQGILELEKIEHLSADEPQVINTGEFGITMSAPEGWYIVKSPISGQYKMVVTVVPPEINAWFAFIVGQHGGSINPDSIKRVVESDMSQMKQILSDYSIDPNSWKAGIISEMQSLSCSAYFSDKNKKMIDYRTYILGQSRLYLLIIRTEKEVFENNKQVYHSIIQSLKVDDK